MALTVKVNRAENRGNHIVVIVPRKALSNAFNKNTRKLAAEFQKALGNPILSAGGTVTVDVKVYPK